MSRKTHWVILTLITLHPWDIMDFFPHQPILWQSDILHFNSILILTTVSIDATVKNSVPQDYPLLQMPIVSSMLATYPQILTWLYMGSSHSLLFGFPRKTVYFYCLFSTKDILKDTTTDRQMKSRVWKSPKSRSFCPHEVGVCNSLGMYMCSSTWKLPKLCTFRIFTVVLIM